MYYFRRKHMKRQFIREVKKGSGVALYMLSPTNGGPAQYHEEIKYILTHKLQTVNDLDFFIHTLIMNSREEEYYFNFLKEELYKKDTSVDAFYNIVTQLSFFATRELFSAKEIITQCAESLIKDTKIFRRKEIRKLDILLYAIQNINVDAISEILKLVVEHNSFKKFSSLFKLEFLKENYAEYFDAEIDGNYIFGENRERKITKYLHKCHQNELDEYFDQINEIIGIVGQDEISYEELDNLNAENRNALFERVINKPYSLDEKIEILMYINLYSSLTKQQELKLIDLFYEHIGENMDFDRLILSLVRFIRSSKVRKLAKYLIKNRIYLEEAASLLAYNLVSQKDADMLFDLIREFNYYNYYNNQLEIIEYSLLKLYYYGLIRIPNINEFYPFEIVNYMYERTENANLRHDMALILDQRGMLTEEDYYVLAFDSTMNESSYFRDKCLEAKEDNNEE